MVSAISEVSDNQYTFCMDCENNIERYYYDSDPEQFPMWTDWKVSQWVALYVIRYYGKSVGIQILSTLSAQFVITSELSKERKD
jgi:hypothetical protein